MTSVGIHQLKDNLSPLAGVPSQFDELVASGVIRPPLEAGDSRGDWPDIRLPAGTAVELMDADRGEA
jgi:hypothetical protein